jgi:hypothetical protein
MEEKYPKAGSNSYRHLSFDNGILLETPRLFHAMKKIS